jgi:site-specific recombinase XerD
VVSALYRWLIEARYVLANPFAGVRVKAASKAGTAPTARAFSDREWQLIRPLAEDLHERGWTPAAAQRLRFVLDFAYATGLRSGELVKAQLVSISCDEDSNWWIAVVGKGNKAGRVAVPPRAKLALDRYLAPRGISTAAARWKPGIRVLGRIAGEDTGLTGSRLWAVVKRFFAQAATELEEGNAALAEKLRRASPHWMRHTHASSALAAGASLTTVRDNLRHASLSTTSAYLHTDELQRARELAAALAVLSFVRIQM